jgi:hypothetical protein
MNARLKDLAVMLGVINLYALAHAWFCAVSFCGADRVLTYFIFLMIGIVGAVVVLLPVVRLTGFQAANQTPEER